MTVKGLCSGDEYAVEEDASAGGGAGEESEKALRALLACRGLAPRTRAVEDYGAIKEKRGRRKDLVPDTRCPGGGAGAPAPPNP